MNRCNVDVCPAGRDPLRASPLVRAYAAAELVALLTEAGLAVDSSWGSWEGIALGEGYRTLLRAGKSA